MSPAVPVSVVLPTFNRAHLLEGAIRSVLGQTHGDLELIIVDDGSSDETEALVTSIADKRIRYLKQAKNRGQSAARNAGIAASRFSLIAFQDSDDKWTWDKLA